MSKIILALSGPIASGKGTIKKYAVEKYGAKECRFSSSLRDVLNRLDVETSRENLQKISTVLRQNFGEDVLAKAIAKEASALSADIIVIDGVRRMADIRYLKELPGFILAGVDADPKIRFERMKTRNENKGDSEKTFETFLKDHEAEADREIPEVMSHATVTFENSGNLEELFEKVDQILKK